MDHYCDWPSDRWLDAYWVCPECSKEWVCVGMASENAVYSFWTLIKGPLDRPVV